MNCQGRNLRRLWILLILRATRLCGFATVTAATLHRLVLFSNSLAPTNDVSPETAKVLKTDYGPYFPDYQAEIDRLIGLGLVDIEDLHWESEDGRFLGKYRINDAGMQFVSTAMSTLTVAARAERAVSETIAAFSDHQLDQNPFSTTVDANYGIDTLQAGELVDYGEWRNARNYASEAAEFMLDIWERGGSVIPVGNEGESVIGFDDEEIDLMTDNISGCENEFATSHIRKAAVYLYAQYICAQLSENDGPHRM